MNSHILDIPQITGESFVARVEHHVSLGSTNDRAKECAASSSGVLPLLIVADAQTAGRGRGSARWWTGPGSLAFSLLLDLQAVEANRTCSALIGLGAAVAVVEAVTPSLHSHGVGLHWPNDVLADGRKLAGILVEVPSDRKCIVGIGLNTNCSIADAPPELRKTATTLLDLTGTRHDRTTVLLAVLDRLERVLGLLSSDPDEIGRRADALCLQHGRILTVRQGNRSVTGRCAGIAPDGALLLDTPDGRQEFRSGTLR